MKKNIIKKLALSLASVLLLTACGSAEDEVITGNDWRVTGSYAWMTFEHGETINALVGMDADKLTVFYDKDTKGAVEKGDKHAILANNIFNRRIADFIGQYYVRLGGCDLIIFSAGIGENEPRTREAVGELLSEAFGVKIDKELNYNLRGKEGVISTPDSKIKVVVIPTDEEVMIARDAYDMCIKGVK